MLLFHKLRLFSEISEDEIRKMHRKHLEIRQYMNNMSGLECVWPKWKTVRACKELHSSFTSYKHMRGGKIRQSEVQQLLLKMCNPTIKLTGETALRCHPWGVEKRILDMLFKQVYPDKWDFIIALGNGGVTARGLGVNLQQHMECSNYELKSMKVHIKQIFFPYEKYVVEFNLCSNEG